MSRLLICAVALSAGLLSLNASAQNAVTEAAKAADTIQRRVELQTFGGRLLPESRLPMLPAAA